METMWDFLIQCHHARDRKAIETLFAAMSNLCVNSEVNRKWFDEEMPDPPERKVTILFDIIRRHGKAHRDRNMVLQGMRLLGILNSQTVQPFGSHLMVKIQELQYDSRDIIEAKKAKRKEINARKAAIEEDRRQNDKYRFETAEERQKRFESYDKW